MKGGRQSGKQHSRHMETGIAQCLFFSHTLKSITTEHSNQNERRDWEVGGGQMMRA